LEDGISNELLGFVDVLDICYELSFSKTRVFHVLSSVLVVKSSDISNNLSIKLK